MSELTNKELSDRLNKAYQITGSLAWGSDIKLAAERLEAMPNVDSGTVTRQIHLGRELFSFSSQQDWVNHARRRFECCGVRKGDYISIDAAGRICTKGAEFMRAEKEGTYPITVYDMMIDARQSAETDK